MVTGEEKKPGIFSRFQTAMQTEGIDPQTKQPIIKKNVLVMNRRTKGLLVLWGVCVALFFFIFPLMIGMVSSGFVDFSNPITIVLGIINAAILVGIGGFAP
ncbi:MAG: hypothetical protein JW791_05040 [Nanoarchaeota archaeon]|nr:hypothetical protein [Nanoarchaeota archaeon]